MTRTETIHTLSVLALAALLLHFIFGAEWLAWLAAGLLLSGASDNAVGRRIASAWLGFAGRLGRFNTRLLLFLVYWLVLTPVALAYRMFGGGDSAHFRKDPGGSLFSDIEGDPCSKESFEKPW